MFRSFFLAGFEGSVVGESEGGGRKRGDGPERAHGRALVLADGTVGEVRIARSLDPVFGLDREAMRAVKAWTFAPATRGGTPISMWVSIELTFTLR